MTGRPIEWATQRLTESDVLAAFAAYCRSADDLEARNLSPVSLEVTWRGQERSVVEIADALPDRPGPTLVLGAITDGLIPPFLDDPVLRGRLAVYDLVRLEKINAVRSSTFVHFEWFLGDEYRVKVLPADAFTRGLVERGIISLGFG